MPSLSAPGDPALVKAMFIGDSKSGKTTALAGLVEAGYTLGILDVDCKIRPSYFEQTLRAKDPKLLDRVSYVQLRDRYTQNISSTGRGDPNAATAMIPKLPATGYNKACKLLDKWDDDSKPSEWGPRHIFVVDTLNTLSQLAFNQAYSMSPDTRDPRQWYSGAQRAIEHYLECLWDPRFKTNVLVLSHVRDIATEGEYVKEQGVVQWKPREGAQTKGFPTTIGIALSKQCAIYTNELWTIERKTPSSEDRHIIVSNSTRMDLGSAAVGLPSKLPAATGLATLFKTLQGL